MQSIQTRLIIGLIFSLIIAFSALWLLVSINIRYVAEEYIASRLVHDAETLLSNIDFDQDSNLVIDQSRIDLVYHHPFSGDSCVIKADRPSIRSRS